MFPQVAPKFFADRRRGTQERRQGPGRAVADRRSSPRSAGGKGPVTGPVHYSVNLGDKTHTVTVEPA